MDQGGPKTAQRAKAWRALPLAVASLLLGLAAATAASLPIWWYRPPLGLLCAGTLFGIVGVISGHIALRVLKRGSRPSRVRGTATAGLAVGYAALACFVLFSYPASSPSQPPGRYRPACRNNLLQIGLALHMYSMDYDEWFPIGPAGTDNSYALGILAYGAESPYSPYVRDASVFLCPVSEDRSGAWKTTEAGYSAEEGGLRPSSTSYVYLVGTKVSDHPDSMVVFDDADRHENGRNALFIDGHTEYLKEEEFTERLIWQMQLLLGQREHSAD